MTRPTGDAAELTQLLEQLGFEPVQVPTIAIDHLSTAPALDGLIDRLSKLAWLVFTSAHGVAAVADRLSRRGEALPDETRIAAVGSQTAAALANRGLPVHHVPHRYVSAAIGDGLGDVSGQWIVVVAPASGSPELSQSLRERGAEVEEVVGYRVIEGPAESRDALHAALHGDLDGLAFTSGSTVRGLLRLASTVDRPRARSIPAFCIGPPTAETARRFGFDVASVASPHTASGLAAAINSHFAREES